MTPLIWFDLIAALVIGAFWAGLELGWKAHTQESSRRCSESPS